VLNTSYISLLLFTLVFALSGCLTLPHQSDSEVHTKVELIQKKVNLDVTIEFQNWQGTRILFTKDQSRGVRDELVEALREFDVQVTDDPTDLRLVAHLRSKEVQCQTLFINSNCWMTILAGPLTLWTLPSSYDLDSEISMTLQSGSADLHSAKSSTVTRTHFHLLLVPLVPLEAWNMIHGKHRKEIYRRAIGEVFSGSRQIQLSSGFRRQSLEPQFAADHESKHF
jgi:hypothetical protein